MIRVDDYHIQHGVIDIERTYGSIFHVSGGVIVCEDDGFIAPERGCMLRWERYGTPNVVFDAGDLPEIAKQAKPIDRWRHTLNSGPDAINTPIGTIERYKSSYIPIHHLRTTPKHRAKVREVQESIRGFHIIDSNDDMVLCAFDSADLEAVCCVLGMGGTTKKAPTRRCITENDKRAIKRMIGEGVKRKDIAEKLGISPQSVSKHAPRKRGAKHRTTRKSGNTTVSV